MGQGVQVTKARGTQNCTLCPFKIREGNEIAKYGPTNMWVHASHFKSKGEQVSLPVKEDRQQKLF